MDAMDEDVLDNYDFASHLDATGTPGIGFDANIIFSSDAEELDD